MEIYILSQMLFVCGQLMTMVGVDECSGLWAASFVNEMVVGGRKMIDVSTNN